MGQEGAASQLAALVRVNPNKATDHPEIYPQRNPRVGKDEFPNRTDIPVTTLANGLTTITNEKCICRKVCKNMHSL